MSCARRKPPIAAAPIAAALTLALAALLAACGEPSDTRLATRCLDGSDDIRARHVASLASYSEVEVHGDEIVIRARVPVGISLNGQLRFKHHTFRCVRDGDDVRLVEAVHH